MNQNKLRAHYFQHVSFEGLGSIEGWLKSHGFQLSSTKFYENIFFPGIDDVDWLIIMGGPMSVNDENLYPWLRKEKEFIAQAIQQKKIVIGICLGAQLIASALGARVYPNKFKEIGWFPVQRSTEISDTPFSNIFPPDFTAFHWHGETFDLPRNAVLIAQNEACKNQVYSVGDTVLGLQFHLETTPESLDCLINNCRSDLVPGQFVQSEKAIMSDSRRFGKCNEIMASLLNHVSRLAD